MGFGLLSSVAVSTLTAPSGALPARPPPPSRPCRLRPPPLPLTLAASPVHPNPCPPSSRAAAWTLTLAPLAPAEGAAAAFGLATLATFAAALWATASRRLGLLNHFLSGCSFGAGLALSGMMLPGKVSGFLDISRAWDPSLALVMGGALALSAGGFALFKGRDLVPAAAAAHSLPPAKGAAVDAALVGGSALFGIGWGAGGLCPGPALASLLTSPGTPGFAPSALFVACMAAGSLAAERLTRVATPSMTKTK